jgi:hypothetical protein
MNSKSSKEAAQTKKIPIDIHASPSSKNSKIKQSLFGGRRKKR